ncbi:MAG: DNA cytosine methyltransferase [Kiritimatiellaceae bacterium]|nr:DNA cytosine methyltransferase [Kiritimatiellaceae bacterium]
MTKAIDLFAGLGGFTTGARMAGTQVVWAANHWPLAVEFHQLNHPETDHICQDLHQADWSQVPAHDLLLASPACQGHSHARGKDRPHHDAARSTAWAVVSAVEYHLPDAGLIENVASFLKWKLYPAWEQAMNALGYSISPHIVDAADHGVPQHRERVFIVATKSKHPIKLSLPLRDHVPVSNIIEWDSHNWTPIRKPGRSKNTLARISRGRKDIGGDRFVMPYYGSGSGLTGRSLDRPIGTITTRDRWAIVRGDKMRMLKASECRAAMGFDADYKLPDKHKDAVFMLGNAVCPQQAADFIEKLKKAA